MAEGAPDDIPEAAPLRQSFTGRVGEFAIYIALSGVGTLVILWLLANT